MSVPLLSTRQIYRIVMPPRRWWPWFAAAAVTLSFALFARYYSPSPGSQLLAFHQWLSWNFTEYAALAGPVVAAILPGILAAAVLFADLRAGRLEGILLTLADRAALVRAYHRRAWSTAALLLLVLAPFGLLVGQEALPLALRDVAWDGGFNHNPALGWIVLHGAGGLAADLATAWLAAALAMAFAAGLRSRAWAAVLSAALVVALNAALWGNTPLLLEVFERTGVKWFREPVCECGAGGGTLEPGYSALIWTFTAAYAALALLFAVAALRLAARWLDRLVTD